jgi:hypothetical protein
MKIETHLHGSGIWTVSMERALQAVYDGLNTTKRKDVWGLGNWPQQGVTNLNAFARRSRNFSVVFELLNNQNKVIGRQTLQSGGYWNLNRGRPVVEVNADERKTLYFQNVNVNDITDNLTIQVATVNGTAAETAARNGVLQIRAVTRNEFDANNKFKLSRGTIQGYTNNAARDTDIVIIPAITSKSGFWITTPEERKLVLVIPHIIWGDPVTTISEGAFKDNKLTNVIIHDSVISIGSEAFAFNPLTSVTIGNSVTTIGDRAFFMHNLKSLIIPNSVKYIGKGAFGQRELYLKSITIESNVQLTDDPFLEYFYDEESRAWRSLSVPRLGFRIAYDSEGKKAGTYTKKIGDPWKYKPQ